MNKKLFWLIVLIPPITILYFITRYGITLPLIDQWELVPFLEKAYYHQLTFADLLKPHGDHPIFFPRLIMIILAMLTKWNITFELIFSFILASCSLMALTSLAKKTLPQALQPLTIVLCSFFVFSTMQWECWGWGFCIQIFMSVLATLLAIWFLTIWEGRWQGIILSAFVSFIACYSFSSGVFSWLLGGILIFFSYRKYNKYQIITWISAGVITLLSCYYSQYTSYFSESVALNNPLNIANYALTYLGSTFAYENLALAICFGLLLLIINTASTIYLFFFDRSAFNKMIPWIALSLFVIINAILTGIGRANSLGVEQALASRYTTISIMYIISTITIAMSAFWEFSKTKKGMPTEWKIAVTALTLLLVVSYSINTTLGVSKFVIRDSYAKLLENKLYNIDLIPNEYLLILYPDASIVRERTKTLIEIGFLHP